MDEIEIYGAKYGYGFELRISDGNIENKMKLREESLKELYEEIERIAKKQNINLEKKE